ncbi:ankyrin repeat-containing domain protein [Favolaschia claudopus]|uniref:Ankyrin repeat-containing domain protein n=1 Tax=Favolaschia claudopus TaxID=2862362 RepID=A0AAW0B9P5_9AGAR
MSTPLKHIQASISTISEQLLTAQKGFGELKDFISSPKEHKLLCTEMRDLEFSLKAVQSAILEDLPGFSPNDKFEEFIASFNISFNEFLHMSQESATSILGLPNTKVKKFTVKIQSFRKQITAQFLDDIFSANYEEKQAQIFKSDQAEQKFCSINITAHGGTGGVGGHGGQQGGLGGRGEGAQLTFNNTNTVYLAAKISSNDNKMNKILNWLTPLNFYQHQDATFATWQKGTGQLFLSLPEFKTWLSNSEKVLWCEGPPGAGKNCAFIYGNTNSNRETQPTLDRIYLIIDALDEYFNTTHEHRAVFIQNVVKISKQPQLKTDIQLAVAQDVGGMFLLAKLRMDHLRAQPTVASLQEGLKTLPSTLGIAYETTMTRINAQAEVAELCQAIAIDNEDTCLTSDKISEIDSIMYFQNAHKQIASTCFQYLAFSDFEELEKINPKLYCLHHTGRTEQFNNWRAIWIALPQSSRLDFWRHGPWPEHEEVIGSLGLAAAANLKTIAKHILRAREVDPKGERLALSLGVYGEHVEIVKTLLQSSRIKPEWGLQGAIQKKHWEIVKMLLEAGADVNIVGGKYGTALQAAAYTESEPIGADVNLVGGYYGSALHAATWRQYEPIVKMLLDNGADMNIVGEQYGSALHAAASIKSIKSKLIVKMLLEAGADVNFVGGEYGTALQAASYTKSEAIVKMLFDAGANVNIVSGEHGTALQAAAWTESEPIVKMLLDAGADVNLVGGYFGTALQAAASIKSKVIVKMLLEAGADVNLVGGYYETALHAAACRESEPIVKMLLDNGADMNIVGGYYGTALQAAAYVESESIVQMLLDNGADMNIVGGQYGGALHAAAWRESEPIVKMLLDAGADVNLVGGYYGTALQTAAYVESESIVQMLLDNGADMNILGGEYGTALQAAAYVNSGSIVNILLEKGADMNILGGEYGTALQAAIAWVGLESDSTTDSDTTADSDSTTDYPAESDPIAESDCTSGSGSSVESDSTAELGYTAGSGSSAGVDSIVKLLLDAGADVNMRGGKYGSALKAAKVLGQQTILQMLLEAGAISTDCDEQEEKATPILQMAIPNPGRLFGFAHKLGGAF